MVTTALLVTNFNNSLAGTDGGGAFTWANDNGAIGYSNDPVSGTLRLTLAAGATVRTTSGANHIVTTAGMIVIRVTQAVAEPSGFWIAAGNYNAGTSWFDIRASSGFTVFRCIDNGSSVEVQVTDPLQDTPTLIWGEWTATQFRVGVYGGATSSWTNRGAAAQTLNHAWGITFGGRGDGTTETMTEGYMGPLAIYDAGLTSDELALLAAADLWTLTTHSPPATGGPSTANRFQAGQRRHSRVIYLGNG